MAVDLGKCLRCWKIRLQIQTVTKEVLHVCPASLGDASAGAVSKDGRPCDSDLREAFCVNPSKSSYH